MQKAFLTSLLLLLLSAIQAQQFGGNSPAIRWNAVDVHKHRIIFPQGQQTAAQRIASLIASVDAIPDSSIGFKRRPIDIVLQKETTLSNGYVGLAPFRSEFYLTPPANPFDQGSLPWVDQLALHEYRHVMQYSNYNRGLAKVFSILLGQQGQAFANALTIPDWFFEGDAVTQETVFSRQGRGRLPSFFNGYRSLWEANANYRYSKLRNGSLKHYVPGHYDLGYQLVTYGREQYGETFWKQVTDDAATMKGLFYPLQKSIRKHTGDQYPQFVAKALEHNKAKLTEGSGKQQPTGTFREELNPVVTENGDLLYIGYSFKKIPAFFIRTAGSERRIRIKDRTLDHYFSYANGKILYAAYRPDTRWSWKDYSELQLVDISSGSQERITKSTKYFSASLSPKADSIVAVYNQPGENVSLHLLTATGQFLKTIPNPEGYYFVHPVFANSEVIAAARNEKGEMALLAIDPVSGTSRIVVPWANTVLGYPYWNDGRVFFTASSEGKDRLFVVKSDGTGLAILENSQSLQTAAGQYQPTVSGDSIRWMQFTANGHKIVGDRIGDNAKAIQTAVSINDPLQLKYLPSERNNIPELTTEMDSTAINPYPKTTKLFRFHSWLPYYEDPEFSFSIMSQNTLNTLQSDLSFTYNQNEGFKKIGVSGTYGGWFPYLTTGLNYTIDRRGIFENKTIYWNETELSLGARLPLNLSKGRSIRYLTAGSQIFFSKAYFREPEKAELGSPEYYYLNHSVVFSNQSQSAKQQFNPPFAQTLRLHYRHTLNLFSSRQFLASSNLYFPGFFANHSIVLNLAGQWRDSTNGLRFSNEMPFARGYYDQNYYRSLKWGINYAFPICYPDIGAFQIIYLLRLRANLFYDQGYALDLQLLKSKQQEIFRSTGVEFTVDTKWWNQLPVSFGIRYSRLLNNEPFGGGTANVFEFILPVNLIPTSVNAKPKPIF